MIPEIDWKNDARIDGQRQIPCRSLPPIQYARCRLGDETSGFVHRLLCVFDSQTKAVEVLWQTETVDLNENSELDDAIFKINLAWKKWRESAVT